MTAVAPPLTGLGGILVAAALLRVWSVRHRDASVADIWWGPGFALLAWVHCASLSGFTPRPTLIALLLVAPARC